MDDQHDPDAYSDDLLPALGISVDLNAPGGPRGAVLGFGTIHPTTATDHQPRPVVLVALDAGAWHPGPEGHADGRLYCRTAVAAPCNLYPVSLGDQRALVAERRRRSLLADLT